MVSLKTLFLWVFISTVQQTWAYNSYMVVCPQAIRPGGDFSCKVTLLTGFRRLTILAQVKSEAANFEESRKFTIRRDDAIKLITLNLPDSMPVQNDYKVYITASDRDGIQFQNNASLTFKEKSMSTLIQTDKAIYKPGQLVQFRCFAVNSKLQVINGTKDIDIFDPFGNKIAQWLDVDGTFSVYQGKFQLSDEPPLGDWILECTVNDADTKKQVFTVEEYVLPKFEVSISLPDFGVMTDKYLAGTVTAKYTFNKGVEGTGKLTIRKQFGGFSEKATEYVEEFDINGEYSFQINRTELFEKLGITFPTILEVEAEVTETLTGKTLSNVEEIQYFDREEKLVFLEGADNFKPGLKYTGYVFLSDQNDQPLGKPDLVINITVTLQSTIDEDIDGTKIGPTTIKLPKNGIAVFSFKVLQNVTSATVLAEYDDDLKVTKFLQQFQSSSKTYVQVSLLTKSPKAGRYATFRITSTARNKCLTYMILSRGNIVACNKIHMEKKWVTLKIMMTAEMAPNAKIVVYFVKRNAEIVVDSISFNVEGIFANDVKVRYSLRSAKPGNAVSLIVNADPGSQCSVLVVDKSVLLLKTGNDITQEMVKDELAMYDSVPPSPCSPFRPCFRLFFPVPNRGTDAASVFREAGLVVMTDAYLHQAEPIWRGPFPPIFLRKNVDVAPVLKSDTPVQSGSEPRVRQIFPETWLFSNEVADEDGKCIIKTTVPDTITTWVATAFAISYKTGLGVVPKAANLRTFLNFFIRLELPYSVIRNEQVILQATVFNFFTEQLKARVFLQESDHFQNILVVRNERNQTELRFRKRNITRTVTIPAESGITINFPIRPVDIGNIDIFVSATSSRARDAVKRQLLVEAEGIPESYNIPILVQIRPWQDFNVTEEITYPDKVVPGSKRIRISAIGDLMGPSINGLTNLLQMPYGCGEQNMITLTPNVYVINYLDAIENLKPEDLSKGQANMLNGYQRQLTFQHTDGSFSAFGNSDPSGSTWLTAFVVKSFAEAKSYIFIDQSVMRKAIDWLLARYDTELNLFDEPGRVIHTEMQGGSASGERSLTAYTLIALLEAVENGFSASNQTLLTNIIDSATTVLEDSVDNLTDLYEMCIISYALALTESNKVDTLLDMLDERATYEGGMKYWEVTQELDDAELRWKPPNVQAKTRNIEATSYVLLTYATINNVTSGLQVIKWLVKQRNPNGGFGSTQDTIIALQALSEFAAVVYNPFFNLSINILCEPAGFGYTFTIDKTNALLYQIVYVPVDTTLVTVTAEGNGTALVEIAVRYNVEEEPIIPLFSLSVSFTDETINGFKLRVCFSWLGEDKSSMAVMEINLLSGFGADRFSVTDLGILKRVDEKQNQLVLYFDEITTRSVCISVRMERQGLVTGSQPAEISLYDYYEPDKRVSTLYQPKILKDTDICDIGGCEG